MGEELDGKSLRRGFRLGPWDVLPDEGALRGPGAELHLEPKQMDLLMLLVRRHGDVVTKEEILDEVWPGSYVAEVALKRNISVQRRALGDDAQQPRFIKTIHRRGYQLLTAPLPLALTTPPTEPAADPPPMPDRISLAPGSRRSIAVLPFADMSRDKDQDYFCEGMAEEIINALCKIEGLSVVSRTSAFQFKASSADTREIGRKLGVGTLLEGSVRKAGGRLRITVQLVDVDDGYHLWSERYDRQIQDVFAVQDEIAAHVAQALRLHLDPREQALLRRGSTHDIEAYDYYLRGRKFYFQYGRREIDYARRLFSRAIECDPHYALAHAGLADCWSFIFLYSQRTDAVRAEAEAASRRAVELDSDSAQVQASRGIALSLSRRDVEAEWAFEKAIRIDPNLFEGHYFYARHCFVCGDLDRATLLYEQASRVRPDDFQSPLLVAQIYDDLEQRERATESRRRGVALAERHLELNPDDTRALYLAANGLVALGETERGLRWARRALEQAPDEPMLLYNVGCIFSLAGLVDEAVDVLVRSVELGLSQKSWFEHDSNLDPLRADARFQALMGRMD